MAENVEDFITPSAKSPPASKPQKQPNLFSASDFGNFSNYDSGTRIENSALVTPKQYSYYSKLFTHENQRSLMEEVDRTITEVKRSSIKHTGSTFKADV